MALVLLVGCTNGGVALPPDEPDEMQTEDETAPDDLAGGNSGGEGSRLECEGTPTTLALDEAGEMLGFSAEHILALADTREVSMRWRALDSGPEIMPREDTLRLIVEPLSDTATAFHCDDPEYPDEHRPPPRLEVPVALILQTEDRMLDERFETVLVATTAERASIPTITVEPEELAGSLGEAVGEFYSAGLRSLMFDLYFGPEGPAGWIGGPFSPHAANPCAYTEYASWPADAECWPSAEAQPTDRDTLEPYLARASSAFELTWDGGETTDATLSVELVEGTMCREGHSILAPVQIRIVTEDRRVDLAMAGSMLASPEGSSDPWPEQHADVEPFTLDLSGAVALDANAVRDGLGYENADLSAAIVTFWVATPAAIDSPLLGGELRAVAIDRTGFSTPLPAVTLPGGGSERCFDSSGARPRPFLQADLVLR
jgi:hypothetical protein